MNGLKNLSAEFELIVLCCRAAIDVLTCGRQPDPLVVSRIGELAGGSGSSAINPERVIELCRRHQVGPMAYRGLLAQVEHRTSNEEGELAEAGAAVRETASCNSALQPDEPSSPFTGGASYASPASEGIVDSLSTSAFIGVHRRLHSDLSVLEHVQSALKEQYLANVLRNERLSREVPVITEWFAEAGIRAVPFKGPVMAWQLYGDVALRPFADLDFILHKDELGHAKVLLERKGFRSIRAMTEAEDRVWRRAGWGYDMSSPAGEFTVDIATGATPDYLPYALSSEEFWKETNEISFNGRNLRVMSPELLLIFLCWHGTKHLWEKLVWAADVHALMAQGKGLDWAKVERLASESSTSRMVGTGVAVVRRVFGDERTSNIQQSTSNVERRGERSAERRKECSMFGCSGSLTPPLPPALVDTCVHRLLGETAAETGWFREQLFFLRMRETVLERLWCVVRTIFRPTISDCQAVRLPASLFGLYYLVRPFRLAVKMLKKLMRG